VLGLRSVFGESLQIYRLLFRRSLVAAAAVYAVIDGAYALELHLRSRSGEQILASFVYTVLSLVGPVSFKRRSSFRSRRSTPASGRAG
jgi:hypothetical protein